MRKILDDATLLTMETTLDRIGSVENMPTPALRALIDNVRRLKQALTIARPWVYGIEGDPAWEDMARIMELVGE